MRTILLCAIASFGGAMAAGTIHSPHQLMIPFGSGVKVAPDPANAWSFHEKITTVLGSLLVPVLVDFDGNGIMDTENPFYRVSITDFKVRGNGYIHAWLRDSTGVRWDITPPFLGNGAPTESFATPIVLPVNSKLWVEIDTLGLGGGNTVYINLGGRIANL